MKIADLSIKWGDTCPELKKAYMIKYRILRDFDMSKSPIKTKGKKRGEFKLPRLLKKDLKSNMLYMMKSVGINVNDINRLRQEAFTSGYTRKEDFI